MNTGGSRLPIGQRGQLYHKASAGGVIILDAHATVMLGDDVADNRQAQPGATFLGREIGQKQFFLVVRETPQPVSVTEISTVSGDG